jgi:hypothetical protein
MHGHPYLATALVAAIVNIVLQPLSAMMWKPGVKERPSVGGVLFTTVFSALFCALYARVGAEWAR